MPTPARRAAQVDVAPTGCRRAYEPDVTDGAAHEPVTEDVPLAAHVVALDGLRLRLAVKPRLHDLPLLADGGLAAAAGAGVLAGVDLVLEEQPRAALRPRRVAAASRHALER